MQPLLMSAKHVAGAGDKLLRKCLTSMGELAEYWRETHADLPDYTSLPSAFTGIAYAALAREVLLLDPVDRKRLIKSDPRLAESQPFPKCPATLAELAERQCGMALFPLAGRRDRTKPALGLVAAVAGEEQPHFIYVGEPDVSGDSWQLAYALARHFATSGASERIALARNWICTGAMQQNQVKHVGLGNKLELVHQIQTKRMWMVPAENYQDPELKNYETIRYQAPATLEDAIAFVTGQGTAEIGEIEWPAGIEELHSFVSEAKEPIILACLLARPKRLILWQTDNKKKSQEPARIVREIVQSRLNIDVPEPIQISNSSSVASTERELLPCLDGLGNPDAPVFFNITQGNFLMKCAPLLLARRRRNLWLIYRDADLKETKDFLLIRFPGSEPLTQRLVFKGDIPGVNWPALIDYSRKPDLKTAEEWADYYFPGTSGSEPLL